MFRDVRVLIIEDDSAELRLFRRVVSSMTFDVEAYGSLAEGLERLESADIMIIDLHLPNGQGDVLLSRWTELHKGPVVVISGYVDQAREHALLADRAWNVLSKPFDLSVLRAILLRYGEYAVAEKRYLTMSREIGELRRQVERARRLAWTLAVIAAAAGASAQPLLSLLVGG